MPIEEIKEYTKSQIRYYLARSKTDEKRLKWEVLLREARNKEREGKVRVKTNNKILDSFKPKTVTTESNTLKEIKMNPRKVQDKLLTKALKEKANKKRIKKQENKTKGMMEYETTVWGESEGQTIIIAKWTESNKTLGQLTSDYNEAGLNEGNQLDSTTYNQNLKNRLDIDEPWLGGARTYTIKQITIKSRMIKG